MAFRMYDIKYILTILYFLLSFTEVVSYRISSISSNDKVALLFVGRAFHTEVASSIACMLHDLDYYVAVYLYDGLSIGDYVIPFTSSHLISSKNYYGNCVSEWIPINNVTKYVPNPSVTIFITYPMRISNNVSDKYALDMLKHLQKQRIPSEVILVTHHSNHFWDFSDEVEVYIPRNRTTYLFLAEHTYNSAVLSLHENHIVNKSSHTYKLAYIFPVLPLSYILNSIDYKSTTNYWKNSRYQNTLFSIQGKFGGKHKTRKNPQRVIDCLLSLESFMKQPSSRTYESVMYMLASHSISLDLIGHETEYTPLKTLKSGRIRKLDGLKDTDFYVAIAHSLFLVTALNSDQYLTTQATSSVPAAINAQVPIIADRQTLNIYPCLRDFKIHKQINKVTECESIYAAMNLTIDEYIEAKNEIIYCGDLFWKDAKETLRTIIVQTN